MVEMTSEKALSIARQAHEGQFDKGGNPYIDHPVFVAEQVREYGDDAMTVAYLHDVVEDSNVTLEDLAAVFSENIVEAVQILTKPKGIEYQAYLRTVKGNELARVVKMADLTHNLTLSRIPVPSEKDMARMEKYKRAYNYLSEI